MRTRVPAERAGRPGQPAIKPLAVVEPIHVERPADVETTAAGAAIAAGLGAGVWPSVAEVPAADLGDGGARFAPAIDAAERAGF